MKRWMKSGLIGAGIVFVILFIIVDPLNAAYIFDTITAIILVSFILGFPIGYSFVSIAEEYRKGKRKKAIYGLSLLIFILIVIIIAIIIFFYYSNTICCGPSGPPYNAEIAFAMTCTKYRNDGCSIQDINSSKYTSDIKNAGNDITLLQMCELINGSGSFVNFGNLQTPVECSRACGCL